MRSVRLTALWQDSGAEQFDDLEDSDVRQAAHVHLKDLPRVIEVLVQEQGTIGNLVRSPGEDHAARIAGASPIDRR